MKCFKHPYKSLIFKTAALLGVVLLLFIIPSLVLGQLPGLPDAPEQTPIDGGLTILAALGGGYAIKKLRDKNKH